MLNESGIRLGAFRSGAKIAGMVCAIALVHSDGAIGSRYVGGVAAT